MASNKRYTAVLKIIETESVTTTNSVNRQPMEDEKHRDLLDLKVRSSDPAKLIAQLNGHLGLLLDAQDVQ